MTVSAWSAPVQGTTLAAGQQGTAVAAWSVTGAAAGIEPGGGTGSATLTWSVTASAAGQASPLPSTTGNATARWTVRASATAAAPKVGSAGTAGWRAAASGAGLAIPAGWVTAGAGFTGNPTGAAPGSEQNINQLVVGLPRGWRYLAQRINRDGTAGPWLDTELPLGDVQLTDVLSGPTQLQATITPEMQRLIASDGEPLLDEWGTAIYAEADGVIRGGVILYRSEKTGAVYTIEGSGFSGYPKGMAYEGALQFRNVDPLDVVRHIWDHVQSGQHSNVGMRLDPSTHTPERIGVPETDSTGAAQDKPYELNWWSTDDLGGEIDKLAADTPFDYHEWHEWISDHSTVIHHLDFGYPLIGRRRDDLRFVLGENIQVMPTVERDGEDYANHVIVLGAGEGSAMIRGEARIDDGRLRRTVTIDAKALTTVRQAQQLARNEATIRAQLGTVTQVVARDTPGTRIGSWGVGDEIRLIADTDWESIDLWFQVVTITYTPDNPDIVTMTLTRAGQRAATWPSSVDRLAVQIASIQRQLKDLSRAPQLPSSSIDSGALTVTTPGTDGNPQTTVIIGQQFDGTSGAVTVAGPTPPIPAAPDFTAVVGGVEVTWDGRFADPQAGFASPVGAPMDFAYVSVEVSDDPDFGGLPKQAAIRSAAGGSVVLAWSPVNTPVYARLRTVSAPGKLSQPSTVSGPVDSGPVSLADLGFNIAQYAGGTKIYYGEENPQAPAEGFTPGDMWLQDTGETGDSGQPLYLLYRWDGIAWKLLQDQGIAQSVAQAISAQSAADDAQITAGQASALAQAAQDTANTKITTWYQATAPSSGMVTGDLWLDTDDGNRLYRWNGSAWISVQDAALQQALTDAGTAQATADRKVQTFDRATAPANPADSLGVGDLWIDTAHGNKLYRWSGSAWVAYQDTDIQTALVNAAAAQTTANTKITSFYTTTAPTTGMSTGDFWLDTDDGNKLYRYSGSAWVTVQDTQIQSALAAANTAQATADGKVRIFAQTTAPTGMTSGDVGDMWIDTDDGNKVYTWSGTAWAARQLGNSAIAPNSLIASNVIATGTVTAALLETLLVLATTLVAGDVSSAHTELRSDGLHLYAATADGVMEVGRLTTGGANYFAFTDSAGVIAGSWDSTGYISASGANFANDIAVAGYSLIGMLRATPGGGSAFGGGDGAQHWYGANGSAGIGLVSTEVGLIEMPVYAEAGRAYLIFPDVEYSKSDLTSELHLRIRDGGTSTPTVPVNGSGGSPQIYYRQFSNANQTLYGVMASDPGLWVPVTSGQHRLLLSAEGAEGTVNIVANTAGSPDPSMFVLDLGPFKSFTNTITNRGGGDVNGTPTPPPPTPAQQQYDTGWLAPTSRATYQGNGTLRGDTSDVVQGWDPSGNNGDGYGFVGFSLPSITGTVNGVQLSLPWNWTYFNSGGTALITPLHSGASSPYSSFQALMMKGQWAVGLSGKSGSVILTLPSDWWPLFRSNNSPQANFIGFGASGGSNETYYVRFTGPDIRLRVLYTQ